MPFVLKIEDEWICNGNGMLIVKYLPIGLEDFILSDSVFVEEKIHIIYTIILNIYELHSSTNIIHRDLHLKNIMLDKNHNIFFIDFGASVDLTIPEDVKLYKRISERQRRPDDTITSLNYLKTIYVDYGKFISQIKEFIILNLSRFSKDNLIKLQNFINMTFSIFKKLKDKIDECSEKDCGNDYNLYKKFEKKLIKKYIFYTLQFMDIQNKTSENF